MEKLTNILKNNRFYLLFALFISLHAVELNGMLAAAKNDPVVLNRLNKRKPIVPRPIINTFYCFFDDKNRRNVIYPVSIPYNNTTETFIVSDIRNAIDDDLNYPQKRHYHIFCNGSSLLPENGTVPVKEIKLAPYLQIIFNNNERG